VLKSKRLELLAQRTGNTEVHTFVTSVKAFLVTGQEGEFVETVMLVEYQWCEWLGLLSL